MFTATTNAPWITLTSGFFGSGDTSLTFLVRPNLDPAPRSGTISIGPQTFAVNQEGRTAAPGLTLLSFKPVAAEYDKALDKIVMVSASPNELHIYDPITQSDQIIPLHSIPLSLSVRPDGLAAAVGHSGSVSIVDLQGQAIIRTIPVDMDNAGVLLASNDYAYIFPAQIYGSGRIESVQVSTAALTPLSGLSIGNIPRLDISGNYIYVGGNGGTSKLKISNGPATLVSTQSSATGNLWLSEDGVRVLTSNGNAYLTSTVPSLDLVPNGRLSASNTVSWAASSEGSHQTAVLSDPMYALNSQLQIYSDEGLLLQKQVAMPSFSSGKSYVSHGRYLFWNAAETKLFAIIQADTSSGLLSDFGVYTVDAIDSIPACSYAISPPQLWVPATSYSNWFFDVTSNCSWSATSPSANNNWLSLSSGSSFTTGPSRVFLSVIGTSTSGRSASIQVGDKAEVITQTAASCTFSLSSTSRAFPEAGGVGTVDLLTGSDCPWSIQNATPWVTLTINGSGIGPATIRYSVSENTDTTTDRTGNFYVAGQLYSIQQAFFPASAASDLVPITPCRVADTRNSQGPFGGPFIAARSTRTFSIPSSNCNIPYSATAYSLNITVVPHGPLNYLTAWPDAQTQPFVSTLNSGDGRVKANAAIIAAGPNKAVDFYSTDPTDLIVDITGYFVDASAGTGLAYYPLPPCRVFDSREADGLLGGPMLDGGGMRQLPILQSNCNLPSSAQAYSLNFTAIPQENSLQYLTTWPSGQEKPLVSTLNSWTGSVAANAAILRAGTGGDINVYVTDDSHLAIDTNGYFAPPAAGGLHLYTVRPCRIFDSRTTTSGQPIVDDLLVQISGICNIPARASAVVVNSTVVPNQTLNYLTLWSGGTRPVVSTLNSYDGAISSNLAITPVSGGGPVFGSSLWAFATDKTQLILDVTGYFAP